MKKTLIAFSIVFGVISGAISGSVFETDTIRTASADLIITFIGHGTLMFMYDNTIIHIDPVSRYADYAELPPADIVLITHHHGDHFDMETLAQITNQETRIICTETCSKELKNSIVMKNGDIETVNGIKIEAVPAYNLVHKRDNGEPYHPKGIGNGYILTLGDKRIYVAGDTENFPEMAELKDIDIAFLPMNLPYTMTPEMVAAAVQIIRPRILYPYHFGNADVSQLTELLKDEEGCEIRIRKMN